MTELSRAKGCLVGLACGDALGRPVEFMTAAEIQSRYGEVTAMLDNGTYGKPAGTITDDTQMALCIAESLVERNGFDGADVATRFVEWMDTDPFDIGLMTRDSLTQIRKDTPWHEAGVDVWENRSEGSNAGNGSVMRCAPHAIAFRNFYRELTYVSRLSSTITHADPRCQWGCVVLNRTIANLIRNENEPLTQALRNTNCAPDELRSALEQVQDVLSGDRGAHAVEQQLSTSGYVVASLQAGLFYGLTAHSAEDAIVRAVNRGGDTDTVGAIAGGVAGARFGLDALPTVWTDEVNETDNLEHLAERLLRIRMEFPGKDTVTLDDGSMIFKGRTVAGPTYISDREFQEATLGHRPHPAPHHAVETTYDDLTPVTAAMLDWERRAYAVQSYRCRDYTGPEITVGRFDKHRDTLVPVPQYPFVDGFDELPEQDRRRIRRDAREAAESFVRSNAAFAAIRHPITEMNTIGIGIERMDPIAGATRILCGSFSDVGKVFGQTNVPVGHYTPNAIEDSFDPTAAERIVAEQPAVVEEAAERLTDLSSGARALLEYLIHLRPPEQGMVNGGDGGDVTVAELRGEARSMVGELHVTHDSLRRIAVRYPEVEAIHL